VALFNEMHEITRFPVPAYDSAGRGIARRGYWRYTSRSLPSEGTTKASHQHVTTVVVIH
jgi:hypothetical protein